MKQCKLNLFPECPGYCPSGAEFSKDGAYRYHLWRRWGDNHLNSIMFIGLNPSTANKNTDDPIIRRLVNFAKRWGYDSIHMYNLFAYVSAYPAEILAAERPISENQNTPGEMCMNDRNLIFGFETNKTIVCCWGSWKYRQIKNRADIIITELSSGQYSDRHIMCFGVNADGQPKHPLYLKNDTELIPMFKQEENQ